MNKIKTIVEIDDEVIFEIYIEDHSPQLIWVSKSNSNVDNCATALSALIKIAHDIALHKIAMDKERLKSFKGPITLG